MRTSRILLSGSALLGLMTVVVPASATPSFPGVIGAELGLSYEPPCAVCHRDGVTGNGTVTTPFGRSLLARGLVRGDDASLKSALAKLAADSVDSDGDGVPDLDELHSGSDPNVEGGESLMGPAPAYGCGARVAPGARFEGWGALVVALGLAIGLRRRSG
jgi:hypothetical protein